MHTSCPAGCQCRPNIPCPPLTVDRLELAAHYRECTKPVGACTHCQLHLGIEPGLTVEPGVLIYAREIT